MHECSAVESLISLVEKNAAVACAGKVLGINVVAGELTGYTEESLRHYFGILTRGTPLEGAALAVRYVKPTMRCPACAKVFERARFSFECPDCGTEGVPSGNGAEFYVDTIETED